MKSKSYQSVWTRCDQCRIELIKFVEPGETAELTKFVEPVKWKCGCGGALYITERGATYTEGK